MSIADIGGRVLSYQRRGSGTPLLLVEGMAMHHQVWNERFLSALAEDYDVIAYDHRGIGDSTDVPGDFSTADLAADAIALLDVLGIDTVHLFGFSMGGMVAQEIALRHRDRVRTFILGGTFAGGEGSIIFAPGPIKMFEAQQSGNADITVRAGYEANLSPTWTADESHWPPFRDLALAQRIPITTIMRQAQAAVAHDASTRLPELDLATLVMHGALDEMIVYPNGPNLAKLIPGATLHTFEDVGHLFWWERHDEALQLIRSHARD